MSMLSFFRHPRREESALGVCFGKAPDSADFVRPGIHSPLLESFEEWLQSAQSAMQHYPQWESFYDQCGVIEFGYQHRNEAFVGAMIPSHDRAGRRSPLVAGRIESVGFRRYQSVPVSERVFFPLAAEGLHTALRSGLVQALRGNDVQIAARELREVASRYVVDCGLGVQLQEQFIAQTPLSDLFALIEQHYPAVGVERYLTNLIFLAHYSQQFKPLSLHQIIRLPLPENEGMKNSFLCFWLHLLANLDHEHGSGSYLLRRDSECNGVVAALGSMPDLGLWALLSHHQDERYMLDCTGEQEHWRSHQAFAGVAFALSRVCANPLLPLNVLLSFCREIGSALRQSRWPML